MRKSFSLLVSIVFMVIMSVIGYLILQFSAATVSNTSRSFVSTRADLMLRSATEYAILALQGHDFSDGCLNSINYTGGDNFFDVNITYHYFTTDDCSSSKWSGCKCSHISTKDTNGSVLIYVTVTSKNSNFHIRKVRVTLQNP
ncbi:MAG: hypothetical protein ABGX26_08570 [Nautiliaceae bacterium]